MRKLSTLFAAVIFSVAPAVLAQESGAPGYGQDPISSEEPASELDVNVRTDIDQPDIETDVDMESDVDLEADIDVTDESQGVESDASSDELPATASPFALIGLGGLASLGGALAARLNRRRDS